MESNVFEEHESNVRSYCRSLPTVFERAIGSELFDVQGRRFLDFFAGAGSLNYGHNPPEIQRELIRYLESNGILHGLDVSTVAKGRFLQAFVDTVLAPRGLDYKVQFCGPTGTNAVEAALKLARRVTGRTGIVAFSGSYHGMTLGSSAVTANTSTRKAAGVPLSHVSFIPYEDGPLGAFDSLGLLQRMLGDPSSGLDLPAAVIVEAVQMDGGIYVASPSFLRGLRELCDRHGLLLIVDDIQAGCGRTGDFFAFERAGIQPDLVTISKSISGNGLPMSLLLIRPDRDQWKPGEHTGTFRGNQLAFVSARVALETFWSADFSAEVTRKGHTVRAFVERELLSRFEALELRGIGLANGVDLRRLPDGPAQAARIQQECFRRGLVVETCGRDDTVVKLLPPLTTSDAQLMEGCGILRDAALAVLGTGRSAEAA